MDSKGKYKTDLLSVVFIYSILKGAVTVEAEAEVPEAICTIGKRGMSVKLIVTH